MNGGDPTVAAGSWRDSAVRVNAVRIGCPCSLKESKSRDNVRAALARFLNFWVLKKW
jgi:hypothetical protein